jgi:hypothetical protein
MCKIKSTRNSNQAIDSLSLSGLGMYDMCVSKFINSGSSTRTSRSIYYKKIDL